MIGFAELFYGFRPIRIKTNCTAKAPVSTTTPKPFVFTLMPFESKFDDVYRLGIKAAAEEANAYAERVDEQIFHESILTRIYNQIAKADLIVADMTGRNPNVFYEVGYAHALGKNVFLLTQTADDIPFDLKHFPHIVYNGRISDLKDNLRHRIEWALKNPNSIARETSADIELYINGTLLTQSGTEVEMDGTQFLMLAVDIHNVSERIYDSSEFQLTVVAPKIINSFRGAASTVTLPDNKRLHVFPTVPRLFPDAWHSQTIEFNDEHGGKEFDVDILIRVFSEFGKRDYPVKVRMVIREDE
jgi:hypothetical protein